MELLTLNCPSKIEIQKLYLCRMEPEPRKLQPCSSLFHTITLSSFCGHREVGKLKDLRPRAPQLIPLLWPREGKAWVLYIAQARKVPVRRSQGNSGWAHDNQRLDFYQPRECESGTNFLHLLIIIKYELISRTFLKLILYICQSLHSGVYQVFGHLLEIRAWIRDYVGCDLLRLVPVDFKWNNKKKKRVFEWHRMNRVEILSPSIQKKHWWNFLRELL